MNPSDEPTATTTAAKPLPSTFETRVDDADFVIRTAEGSGLFVHQLILRQTSPIFATLFTLPQPTEVTPSTHPHPTLIEQEKDGLPTVAVMEKKAVWDAILCLLYHKNLVITSPYDMSPILEAARKYELDCVTTHLEHTLSHSLHTAAWDAMGVYAVASMYGLSVVAQQAARATLRLPLPELYTRELPGDVPAHILQRLLDYRWRCQEAARGVAGFSRATVGTRTQVGRLFKRIDWLPHTNFVFFQCDCGAGAVACAVAVGAECELFSGRAYWKEYMERAEQAVKERPVGGAVKDPEIIMPALRAADNCAVCRQQIYLDMMAFTEYLATAVDEATSSVTLRT